MMQKNSVLFICTCLLVLASLFITSIWYIVCLFLVLFYFLYSQAHTRAFLFGFIGVFCIWYFAMLVTDYQNKSILSQRISIMFNHISPYIIMFITAIIGGILGGFSALLGKQLRITFGLT